MINDDDWNDIADFEDLGFKIEHFYKSQGHLIVETICNNCGDYNDYIAKKEIHKTQKDDKYHPCKCQQKDEGED